MNSPNLKTEITNFLRLIKLNKKTKEYNQLLAKYKDIIDLEEYKEKIKKESEQIIAEKNQNVDMVRLGRN